MLPEFNKITLKNELDVYHIPVNLGSNVISVNVFYKVGSRNETMGKSGIAHMLEHLNFKSTKNRNAGEFDKIVKGFGGVNNASTSFDYTHYFIKCSKENLEKSLELYADIMENLNLKDEEFQPERDVVLEERLWRTDNNPFGYLFFRLYNNAFLYHPYHWTPIGFKDDIKNWKIEDIRDFHSKFYQPKNAFIVISGDIEKDIAFNSVKKYFENIENRQELPTMHTYEPKQDGEKLVYIKKDSEVEILAMAYKIPPFLHKDSTAIEAIREYLGEGKSSILNKILVDEKKLASNVEVYNFSSIDENLFIIFAICNQGIKAESIKAEILEILESEKEKDISDDDFEKIKNSVKSDIIYSFDSASKTASIFGNYIAKDGLDDLIKTEEKIALLNKEDIKNTLNTYFVNNSLTTLILRKD
ncbi:zinc-dependent peptidase, M16 family [Campylobacter blaseri]|uniref:Peptidase M16 n=1 Tax=Campylobacter blaseri TaxID=2042961 RepID=A0A2P8R2L3_9BACT|nr:pitrilysin family protein [Campylobacter blaseri]PSM52745.1 peptidase M16 [Campylobacter blaseri]PSM54393.1 peptidase M16 [Campylobacter blaseri]QKF86052.1 zinc-dependent peptidase, M16 family [Campylobacter blaseri]